MLPILISEQFFHIPRNEIQTFRFRAHLLDERHFIPVSDFMPAKVLFRLQGTNPEGLH